MFALIKANLLACILGLAAATFLVISVVQSIEMNGFLWIDGLRDKLEKCEKGRTADRQAYADAQRKAHELNEAEVKRIEQEQQRISSDVESNLNARLERLRGELRNAPVKGSPNGSKAGPDGKAPGGADGQAGVCLAPEELLSAAESEERHDQLITWVEKQLGVKR